MMAPNASRKRSTLTRIVLVVLVGALMGVTLPGELGTAPPFPSAHSAFTVAATAGSSATSPRSAPQVTLNESTLVLFNNSLIQGDYDSVSSSLPSLEVFDPTSNELFVEGFYSGVIDVVSTELNEVVATISTGAYPNTLAYDSQNNNIYFGLQEADLVGTVNASTGLVQRTVNIGFEPLSMAADPVSGNLFVTGWNATGTAFLAVISGASGVVLTSFPFANGWFPVAGPNGLAYVPASGNFYLASFPSGVPQYQPGNLTLVDASTFAVVANVSLPFAPSSVLYAPSTRNLYLGNSSGDNLSVFDPATTSLVGSIQLPNLPTMLTYASTHERVYVGLDGNVSAVSTTLNKVTKTFPVTREPDGLAFDSHDGDLYISDYVWNNVSLVNTTSYAVAGAILLGALPYNMAYDNANGDLYVADLESSQLIVVNATTNRVVGYVPLGTTPYGIVYDPLTKDIYVDDYYAGNVSVVSGTTNSLIGYLPAGLNPWGIAYDGANHYLYVTNVESNNITILNPAKGTVVKSLSFTTPPGAIAYDAKSSTLFVGEYNVGNVSVLNATTNRLIRNTTTGSEPYTISVDPHNGEAFVGNYASYNVTVLGSRGQELGLSAAAGVGVFGSTYNPVDGDVYVASFDSDLITVINGTSGAGVGGYSVGIGPVAVAANPVSGTVYVANYDSGSLTVLTRPVTVATYSVTFAESGLPHGRGWSVAFNGVLQSTKGSSLTFAAPNGTFTYLVTGPYGYDVIGLAPEGSLLVHGAPVNQPVSFGAGTTYSITFTESGLPAGTTWCVSVGSKVCSLTTQIVFKNLTDGTYTYNVIPGYNATPGSGTVKISGASVKVKVAF